MEAKIEFIPGGTVTSPKGFHAGATYAGINKKAKHSLDLGILWSEVPSVAAALFTTNRIKAAPVILCQQRLQVGRARALVVNSGCANAFTGEQGLADAAEVAELAAEAMGLPPEDVLAASTGVIGPPLPMKLIRTGIERIVVSTDGGHKLAEAMITTDTMPKETAVAAKIDGAGWISMLSKITVPLVKNHLVFISILIITSAFREFDVVYSLTGGGPGRSTTVLSLLAYNRGLEASDMGYANAVAFSMFIMMGVICWVYVKMLWSWSR